MFSYTSYKLDVNFLCPERTYLKKISYFVRLSLDVTIYAIVCA